MGFIGDAEMYLTAELRYSSGYSEPRKQRNFDSDGSPAARSTGLGKVRKEDPIELKSGVNFTILSPSGSTLGR